MLIAVAWLTCARAAAFPLPELQLSGSLRQEYNDNVFGAPDGDGAFITRFAPSLGVDYEVDRWSLTSGYTLGLDIINDQLGTPEWNRGIGLGHFADANLRHRATRRLTWGVGGTFIDTPTPADLDGALIFDVGRFRTRHFDVGPTASYRVDRRLLLSADYSLARDELRGVTIWSHRVSGAGEWRFSRSGALVLDLQGQFYTFSELGAAQSFAVVAGWRQRIWRNLTLELGLGPRLARQSPEALATRRQQNTPRIALSRLWSAELPDAYASVRFTHARLEAVAAARRTASIVVGLPGLFQIERASARVEYGPLYNLTGSVGASVFRLLGEDSLRTAVGVEANYAATPWLMIRAAYQFGRQDFGVTSSEVFARPGVNRNRVSIGAVIRPLVTGARSAASAEASGRERGAGL